MKSIRKPDMMLSITLVFYICLAAMPFFISGGPQITHTLEKMFCVFPANLLLYVTPAALFFAARKNKAEKTDKTVFLLICDTLITILMYSSLNLNSYTETFSLAALLVLSFVCMNSGDIISMAILLPGLLIFKLGTEFIFACYIPILLLLLLKTMNQKKDGTKEKGKTSFLSFAYLYISVLAIILIAAKKISFIADTPLQSVSGRTETAKIISGIILLLIACTLFLIRVIPAAKNSISQTVTAILFALYPLALSVTNLFFPVMSSEAYITFIFALIMYTVGNAQLTVTYGEKAPSLLPCKMPSTTFMTAASVLFLFFIAE